MNRTNPSEFRHSSFRGRVGIARADITPPVGIYARNWGASGHNLADSIHRPLTLTALTLASTASDQPQVLIDADLGWWKTPTMFHGFQSRLLSAFALSPAKLLVALSHTHSGPPLMEPDPSLPGSKRLQEWTESLFETTVRTVKRAIKSAVDATVDWQTGHCDLATNRDLLDPDPEKDRILCGFNPDGKPDDMLLVGRITDSSGSILGTLVNYACHPTTLAWDNTAISPDYVGAMRETIQTDTGAPAIFLLGACGDLAPRYQYVGDTAVADRHGRQLGFAALSTLQNMEPPGTELAFAGAVESGAPLAIWKHATRKPSEILCAVQTTVELPIKNWPSAETLEQQRLACTDRVLEERLRRKRDIRRGIGDSPTFSLPIHAWRIGDAVLVGCCCEPYSILQRELRCRFPDRTILCLNLVNGSIGYLPPANLYDTEVYPVWQTPFDRGSLEKTLEAMTQAIEDVTTN